MNEKELSLLFSLLEIFVFYFVIFILGFLFLKIKYKRENFLTKPFCKHLVDFFFFTSIFYLMFRLVAYI